jgi:hypothetical protein
VVLVTLRLGRLLLSGPSAPLLAAIAAAASGHVLAAVHPAVAVPVRAAIAAHSVALMLVMLTALLLALWGLVPAIAGVPRRSLRLVLRMVLVRLCRRGRLSGGRHGERKRDRTDKNLHFKVS